MQSLDKTLRKQLETTVKEAREIAETAARVSLSQLGVGEAKPYPHLSEDERELRRKLRAHGRQLGDVLSADGKQEINWLLEEVAYEHWHRMLFVRFLAENDLLMYPDPTNPVSITLKECEELAAEEGARNGWELASRYATRMLPQIFRPDSPVFSLILPPEHERKLERLLDDLTQEVFLASDSIGWVYQFWQSKKKDEVNASEVKIGARELPAVTQLFTEPYMVSFLLDNSLGAWWASRRLTDEDLRTAVSEEELRQKASLPGVPLEYLRFVKTEDRIWTPAAGTFDSWPEHLSELKTLDPCCGSGHFLVAALLMLVPMRMELEGFSAREAVDAVLQDNLHGLEIDKRCVELAAFALALNAWSYPTTGGYRVLPELNIACSGMSINANKEEWGALAGDDTNLYLALEKLYRQFENAPILGSLIKPELSLGKGSLFEQKWDDVGSLVIRALLNEKSYEKSEMKIVAKGLSKSADLLQKKYDFIATNVPYRQSDDLTPVLYEYIKKNYPLSKSDIATVFHQRLLALLSKNGVMSLVMPQGFLYKDYYAKYRKQIFSEKVFSLIARLGAHAFREIGGEEVKVILSIVLNIKPQQDTLIHQIDVTFGESETKENCLKESTILSSNQYKSLVSKKHIVILDKDSSSKTLLEDFALFSNGIQTGDYPRFGRFFWEIPKLIHGWDFQLSTVDSTVSYGGREHCLYWGDNDLVQFVEEKVGKNKTSSWLRGLSCRGEKGVAISAMGELKATLFTGEIFDDNTVVIIPNNKKHLGAIWKFCSSPKYNSLVRKVDQSNKVRGALLRVPFKITESDTYTSIPKICTLNPTQWIFHGHPCGSVVWDEEKKRTTCSSLRTDETVLQVAVARLLGYRWPAELDTEMELADEQREWVNKSQELLPFADKDGIVCIPPVRGEASAEDRLLDLLAASYSDSWSNDTLATLLKNADHEGRTLETWLRDKFFTQHIKLFQHCPFIWHIWDGLRDGFAALINYHKLDSKLLESLIYTYLGDWISRQKQDLANGVDGAQEKLDAAESLKKKLELILKGENPYDVFVRWKPIEQQPIGWNPDLNDGVRLNIRPFMSVPDVGKKGAGVLRDKPNINWNKDRGKDVESAPWFHLFQGDRINDNHLSLDEKRKARERTV